jgi:dolichol kinase
LVEPISYRREVYRKISHMFLSVFAFALLFWDKQILLPVFITIAVIYFLVDLFRRRIEWIGNIFYRFFGLVVRNEEATRFTGAANAFIGIALTVLLFENSIAIPAILIVSFSDAFAAIVGRKIGKTKIGSKSLEGSAAFFICTLIILSFCNYLSIAAIIMTSLFATILELFPIRKINDNISIPLMTALFIQLTRNLI